MKVAEPVQLFQGAHILMSNKCKRFFFLTELAPFLPWRSNTWWLEFAWVCSTHSVLMSSQVVFTVTTGVSLMTVKPITKLVKAVTCISITQCPLFPPTPPPHSHNHGCPLYAQATLWSSWHVVDHKWLIFTVSLCSSSLWDLRGTDHVSFIVVSPSMHTVFST